MAEHSPEPWVEKKIKTYYEKVWHVISGDGKFVWHEECDTNYFPSDEDRRRIIACVNACRGIPTEVLESAVKVMAKDSFEDNCVTPHLAAVFERFA